MKWYFKTKGEHTHVRVFMGGALCGTLCFRNEEFEHIRRENNRTLSVIVEFIAE